MNFLVLLLNILDLLLQLGNRSLLLTDDSLVLEFEETLLIDSNVDLTLFRLDLLLHFLDHSLVDPLWLILASHNSGRRCLISSITRTHARRWRLDTIVVASIRLRKHSILLLEGEARRL